MSFEIDPGSTPLEPAQPTPEPKRSTSVVPWLVALLLLGAVVAGGYWYLHRQAPAQPIPQAAPTPAPAPAEAEAPAEAPPTARLHGDALFRDWAARLFDGLEPKWLSGGDWARRVAGSIEAAADGQSPRAFLVPLVPGAAFSVDEADGKSTISSASFARYDALTHALGTLHVDRVAPAWAAVRPAIAAAWREIAPPGLHLEDALGRALGQIVAAPVVSGPVEVVSHGTGYQFADPKLEALPPIQKLLVRTGPANQRRLQAQARALAHALGVSIAP